MSEKIPSKIEKTSETDKGKSLEANLNAEMKNDEKFQEKALDYMEGLLKRSEDYLRIIMPGLAGIDKERAWQMREKFLESKKFRGGRTCRTEICS